MHYIKVVYNKIKYVESISQEQNWRIELNIRMRRARKSPMSSRIKVGYEGTKSKSWHYLDPHFPALAQVQHPPRLPSHHPKPSSGALSPLWF